MVCVACCEGGIGLHRDVSGVDGLFGKALYGNYFSLMRFFRHQPGLLRLPTVALTAQSYESIISL